MKRSLLLSVCAASLAVVMFTSAQATVNIALELRYTHPADPSQGGDWRLVAKDTANDGLAGVSAVIDGLDLGNLNLAFPHPSHSIAPVDQFVDYGNGAINVVFGHDLDPPVAGVGSPGNGDNRATDPFGNSDWDDVAVLVTGTFGATRPSFGSSTTGKETEVNVYSGGVAVQATIGMLNVRGDSLNTLGLEEPAGAGLVVGDANRDGAVGAADSAAVFNNWNPGGTSAGWNDGSFSGSGAVGAADSAAVFNNWNPAGTNYTPPAIAAVPEPTTVVLLTMACVAIGFRRRVM